MLEYNDRVFKKITSAGAASIVLGIVTIVVGIGIGVMSIVYGGNLLTIRKHLID